MDYDKLKLDTQQEMDVFERIRDSFGLNKNKYQRYKQIIIRKNFQDLLDSIASTYV